MAKSFGRLCEVKSALNVLDAEHIRAYNTKIGCKM